MTFDENTATSLKIWSLLFLKPQSRELNLSNKMLKVKIGGFYGAVRWLKVRPNWRIWADIGNTKDIDEESQKPHPRPKKYKIRKLRPRMGTMVRASAKVCYIPKLNR